MTPEAIAGFRSFFRLRDLLNGDDPEALFAALVDLARWAINERANPGAENDALLKAPSDFVQIYMGLSLHLATVDRHFFNLAKRMAARTLVRHREVKRLYLEMAAALLASGEGPRQRKPTVARDAALILAISVGQDAGWKPTESNTGQRGASGCARAADALGFQYEAIEKVWKCRLSRLQEAGFTVGEASDFFSEFVR